MTLNRTETRDIGYQLYNELSPGLITETTIADFAALIASTTRRRINLIQITDDGFITADGETLGRWWCHDLCPFDAD